jgi:hypothetical protein
MGALALFLVLSGGTAVALQGHNRVFSDDIVNGNLNDQDVGQGTFVNFAANIGTIDSGFCKDAPISGIDAQGDHLLLTPSAADDDDLLDYSIRYQPNFEAARLVVCNHTNFQIEDGTTHFNLLVFDAQ